MVDKITMTVCATLPSHHDPGNWNMVFHVDSLVQDCSIFSALEMEILHLAIDVKFEEFYEICISTSLIVSEQFPRPHFSWKW